MFAVVLVGGFGTRLRPITNDVPKPMLPVVHRPMIVRLVERLAPAGVTDVVLALGFRPEPFAAAFDHDRHDGIMIHYAVEPEPLDTGGAIAFAARSVGVDDTFLVANGDIITDLDPNVLLAEHRRLGARATIHLTPVDDPSAFGVVELEPDGRVRRFVEKPPPGETDSNLINAGTYVMEPAVLDAVDPGRRVSVEREVFPALVDDGTLVGVATDDYWIDAGRPDTYLQANIDWVRTGRHADDEAIAAGAHVDPEAMLVEAVVHDGVTIGAGATVTESMLLNGASVDAGATVERSIVAGHVGAGATVHESVIGAGWTVAVGETVAGRRLPEPD